MVLTLGATSAVAHKGIGVELVGRSKSVLPTVDAEVDEQIRKALQNHQIKVRSGVAIQNIRNNNDALILEGTGYSATADVVPSAGGGRPASQLARSAGVETGIHDACKINRRMETNLADVYAAGDRAETWHRVLARATWLPLGTTAYKRGPVAGENAIGGSREFAGAVGAQFVKVFDLAIARTGLLDHEAASSGLSPSTITAEAYDHQAYYPGQRPFGCE
jgi:NADPH-dependent 2,4-dienoyl-CoA reductase/sulfur reductase-like enzyme